MGFGGDFFCFMKEEMVDSEGEGRVLWVIFLFFIKVIILFIGVLSMFVMFSIFFLMLVL